MPARHFGVVLDRDDWDRLAERLVAADIDFLTIGQYLQPTPDHLPIDRWVTPEEFQEWKTFGLGIGFGVVESGPLVRSSYHADEQSAKYVNPEPVTA